jgi:adenylate cyclase
MPEPLVKEIKVNYKKSTSFFMAFGVILVLVACDQLNVPFFGSLENKAIDFRFNIRGSRTPQAPIKLVAVDEKSLKEVGQWPWPRATHAKIIRLLKEAGAKVVFYDVFFPEPERTQEKMLTQLDEVLGSSITGSSKTARSIREKVEADVRKFQESQNGDAELAAAMKEAHNVFLLIEPFSNDTEGTTPDPDKLNVTPADLFGGFTEDLVPAKSLLVSIPLIQQSALDSGHSRLYPYADGIYRSYPTVVNYQGKLIPHESLQVARYFLGVKEPIKFLSGDCVKIGNRKIPMQYNGFSSINFCGPYIDLKTNQPTFPYYSASDLLNGRIKPGELKDSAVVFGVTATGLFDLRPTPYSHNAPGMDINATILENAISGNFLTKAPDDITMVLIIVAAMLMWYLIPRLTPIMGTVWFLLAFAIYIVVCCVFFGELNYVLDLTYPCSALVLTFLLLTTYKFRTEVRHSRYMKQMFQSMVAPSVVEEILKLPAGIELGGEEKNLTVMFSDVRGFTTFSEKHKPHDVVEILNEYLTQMTYLVFQTEGTLDKYIGDAIMAFWGAPTVQQDHAYRACSTALGMVDLLHTVLHPKWELEGKEKLEIGVGLNTGPMVVGFVGSESMKSYTLIGDAVNLGSRLEGTTKEYHVEIIIAESTYDVVKNDMLCRELDLIKVKGKNEPIRIYELVDHRLKGAGAKEMKVKAFEEGLALYRAQKWDEAIKCFKNCLELDPKDGPAEIFMKRCSHLKQDSPGANWDGVFVMKTK